MNVMKMCLHGNCVSLFKINVSESWPIFVSVFCAWCFFFSLSSLLWRVQKNAKSTKWERWKVLERPFADVKVILFTLSLKTDFDILYVFNILLSLAIHKIFRSTYKHSLRMEVKILTIQIYTNFVYRFGVLPFFSTVAIWK